MRMSLGNLSVSAAALVAVAAGGLGITGCASSDKVSIGPGSYEGPEIRRSVAAGKHTVVLTAPSGGWAFRLDETRPKLETTQVFVTAQRPNPAYMQAQALVQHEVTTGVATDQKISVYARVLDHDESSGPYRPVAMP
jgi:hypothetical protein